LLEACRDGHQLGQRVRLVLGDHLLVGKPPRSGAAAAKPTTPACKARSGSPVTCEGRERRRSRALGPVRGCPLGTGQDCCEWHASGTAGEDDVHGAWQCRHQLDGKVKFDPGDACPVGRGRRPTAEVTWGSKPLPSCASCRGPGMKSQTTCDSGVPALPARARRGPVVSDGARTQHGPGSFQFRAISRWDRSAAPAPRPGPDQWAAFHEGSMGLSLNGYPGGFLTTSAIYPAGV
jgi:hypothetical protein